MCPFCFRLDDYPAYRTRVGDATYIDASRRTDPACIDQVWKNLEELVDAFGAPWILQVWTKSAVGVIRRGGQLLQRLRSEGTTVVAQVTVTGLGGTVWEPRVPKQPFLGLPELADLAGGAQHVTWRYDPIIPSIHTIDRYESLLETASAIGISRNIINFIAPPGRYKRVDARLAERIEGWPNNVTEYNAHWRRRVAADIASLATAHGLCVACCAESADLAETIPGLHPARCGDYDWFVDVSGVDPGRPAGRGGSRPGCGCAPYFDVGMFGQRNRCHQCLYCYAG